MRHTKPSSNASADIYDMNDALTALFNDMERAETCADQAIKEVKPNSILLKALLAIEALPVFKFAINKALNNPETHYESLVR